MKKIEELFSKIRTKQQISQSYDEELNALLSAFEPTYYSIISEIAGIYSENLKMDLLQEGRLAVCKAVASFNSKQDATFYTFAYTCIKNAMFDFLRAQNAKKNTMITQAISLEDIDESEIEDPSLNIENTIDIKEELSRVCNILNETQQKIAIMLMEGYSYQEIANKLDKNKKYIDNQIQQIRKKLNN